MIRTVVLTSLSLLTFLAAGCELITIGPRHAPQAPLPDIDQTTAVGAVYLFKAELDQTNTDAASFMLAAQDGNHMPALDKYEMQWELLRFAQLMAGKEITRVQTDTLSNASYAVTAEFSYITTLRFTTVLLEDKWFISSIALM